MSPVRTFRTDVLIAGLVLAFTAVPTEFRAFSVGTLLSAFHIVLDPEDMLANVIGYIPLGMALARRSSALALGLSAVLSTGAEAAQIFCVGRSPAVIDVLTNILGAGIGAFTARVWNPVPERVAMTRPRAFAAAALAVAYIATGATGAVEPVLDKIEGLRESPPWMAQNPRGSVADGGLEAEWSFDRADHGVIADVSGHGVDGRAVRGPTLVPGVEGFALHLDGRQWVDLGTPVALRLAGSMTLSAWIRVQAFPVDDAVIISSLTNTHGYQLDLTLDQGPRTVGFKVSDAEGHQMARYGKTPIVAGRWYHVAGVYDAAARTLAVYVNGHGDNGCLLGTVGERQNPHAGHVFLGRRDAPGFEFIGALDDVRVESRPESQAELRAQARAAGLPDTVGTEEEAGQENDTVCPPDPELRPRVAGPLVSLGLLVVLACAGFWPWPDRFELAALSICAIGGVGLSLWVSPAALLRPVWLPLLYLPLGGSIGLLAARTCRRESLADAP